MHYSQLLSFRARVRKKKEKNVPRKTTKEQRRMHSETAGDT